MSRLSGILASAAGCAAAFSLLFAPSAAKAASPDQVLANGNVDMFISSGVGGTNDAYARLIAEHMGRHLPGKPNILTRNMPGAGGLKATMFLYTQAARDGTAMGVVQRSVATQPLFGIKGADYNPLNFHWIGSTASEVSAGVVWDYPAVQTIQDLREQELLIGSSGVGNDTGAFPRVVNYFLKTKLKPIHGYVSGSDIILAMERGEVKGRFGWSWGSVKSREPERLKNGTIRVILQMGLRKAPDLDAPLIVDLAENESDRKAMEVIFAPTTIGWPSLLPPEVPADMVKAYRDAYKATMADPEFVAAAKKRRLDIDPVSGEEIQAIIANVFASPPEIVALARKAFAPVGTPLMAKILTAKGKVSKINSKGSQLTIDHAGSAVDGRIAGRTKVLIAGKPAKRGDIAAGMSCSMALVASGAVAHQITCD